MPTTTYDANVVSGPHGYTIRLDDPVDVFPGELVEYSPTYDMRQSPFGPPIGCRVTIHRWTWLRRWWARRRGLPTSRFG